MQIIKSGHRKRNANGNITKVMHKLNYFIHCTCMYYLGISFDYQLTKCINYFKLTLTHFFRFLLQYENKGQNKAKD